MLTHATDPNLFVVETTDLERSNPPPRIHADLEPLRRVVRWAEEYLSQPHPELGREGPVCPYVQTSMRKQLFFLTVRRGRDLNCPQVEEILSAYRRWFLEIEPTDGPDAIFKTILVLFPDLDPKAWNDVIEAVQGALKSEYVAQGLMIGEFHPGPPRKAGLWNPDFRPLQSPVPMLVIRHMVPTDFAFLRDERPLLATYLARFQRQIPGFLRDAVKGAAQSFGLPVVEPDGLFAVHPQVMEMLRQHQVPVVIHEHKKLAGPIDGPHDVARSLGIPLERITKSVLLRCSCHGRYSVVVAPVGRAIDLEAVARALGCQRVVPATQLEVVAVLAFSPGGISPVAVAGMPVLVDEALLAHPTVLIAAGVVEVEIEIDPTVLCEVTGAQVVSFTRVSAGSSESMLFEPA
ncbi:MAG TPA: YbaK/EbsC family protein [Thermoanaerobaculia bacterium]|nr:YbaK/EbsC family protein [Thermoanaerobaculia bacterium]